MKTFQNNFATVCTINLIDPRTQKLPGWVEFFFFNFFPFFDRKISPNTSIFLKFSSKSRNTYIPQRNLVGFDYFLFYCLFCPNPSNLYFFQNWTLMNREWLKLPGWSTNCQSPTNVCLKFCVVIWKKLLQNPTKI